MSKKVTYTDDGGEEINADDIAAEIDSNLESSGRIFVHGSDGHRYLVSVGVKFVRSDE